MLKKTLRDLHGRVAELLSGVESHEAVAHHLSEAGRNEEAVESWREAGRAASAIWAAREAAGHFRRGLDLAESFPMRNPLLELELLTELGVALTTTEGYATGELETLHRRTRTLAESIELPVERRHQILWGPHLVRADLEVALELARELQRNADSLEDLLVQAECHHALGASLFHRGRFDEARPALLRGLDLSREATFPDIRNRVQDPVVAWLSWLEGDEHTARRLSQESLDRALSTGHPYSQQFARYFTAAVAQCLGERERVSRLASDLLCFAEAHDFSMWRACGLILSGWAAEREGLQLCRRGVEELRALGSHLSRSYFQALLAEVALREGRREEAVLALEAARVKWRLLRSASS